MTDRLHSLTVVLEKDTRDDDAMLTADAIRQLRNVLSVTGNVANVSDHIAQERAKHELGERLMKVIYPKDY